MSMPETKNKLVPYIPNCRYYQIGPERKTVEECASHGADHKAYGWLRQLDPRWSKEQREAYDVAYAETEA